jgi:hypothetical protein
MDLVLALIVLLTIVFCTVQILEDFITLDKSQALKRQHLLSVLLGIDFLKVQNIGVYLCSILDTLVLLLTQLK